MEGAGPSFGQEPFHDPSWNDLPDRKGSSAPRKKKKPAEREIQPAPQASSSSRAAVGRVS